MVEQKQRYKTFKLSNGQEVKARILTREDIEQRLAEFEAKYAMTSQEFIRKWKGGELKCADDYFDWAMHYDSWRRARNKESAKVSDGPTPGNIPDTGT